VIRPELVRVALLPIRFEPQQKAMASELEQILRKQLLETKQLRFLSASAVESQPQNPFPYLSSNFGTRWIIEGNLQASGDKAKIRLSLVDATNALVFYTLNREVDISSVELNRVSNQFISDISDMLGLNSLPSSIKK